MKCPAEGCDGTLYRVMTVGGERWRCDKCPAQWTRLGLERRGVRPFSPAPLYDRSDQEDDGEV
jgi:hypothetical protein